jgi:hypothetical protein
MKLKRIITAVIISLMLLSTGTYSSDVFAKGKRHRRSTHYTNTYKKRVHKPVRTSSVPAGATAECRDGTFSFSANHRGTCSHHGGVKQWFR